MKEASSAISNHHQKFLVDSGAQLRNEFVKLQLDRDILEKAAAYFGKKLSCAPGSSGAEVLWLKR